MPLGATMDTASAHAVQGHPDLLRALFWAELRRQAGSLRFCRNYPTGSFVHDFYCLNARLAVRVETAPDDPAAARVRSEWLTRGNIAALAVSMADIREDLRGTVARVLTAARKRLPHAHPAFSA